MSAQYVVGQVLPNGATVTADTFVTLPDGTTVETMVDSAGNQTRSHVPGPGTATAIKQTIFAKAQAALTANATYLAIPTPTTAQAVAQVATLTREVSALVRLIIQQFDSVSGT